MDAAISPKDSRLFIRCQVAQKELLERAAASLGMSLSDYVLSTVLDRSRRELQSYHRIQITAAAMQQLEELMSADLEPSADLTRNMAGYRKALKRGTLTSED